MKRCSYCGAEYPDEMSECPVDHKSVVPSATPTPRTNKNKDKTAIPASRLLAYDQQMGFTRLKSKGGTVLDVREGTGQIDRLVRAAAARGNPALQ